MSALAEPTRWLHLDWVLVVVSAWLLIGVFGVFALRRLAFVAKVLFPAGGAVAMPDSAIVRGLADVLSHMKSFADCAPGAPGENVALTWHEEPREYS